MKIRNALSLTLLLSISLIGNAQADRGYYDRGHHDHGGHRGYYNAPQQHHNHGRNWGVPAAVLAITGLAIGAAAYQSYQPRPAYVYSAPPPTRSAAARFRKLVFLQFFRQLLPLCAGLSGRLAARGSPTLKVAFQN